MTDRHKILEELKSSLRYQQSLGLQHIPKGQEMPKKKTTSDSRVRGNDTQTKTLEQIRQELGDCTRCRLCEGRKNIVFGVGNPHAELMFIGEGPGRDEDTKGEPFVGRAGKLLDNIIEAMGMKRSDVYIGNIVKCLRYNAMVQLGNGKWERIGRLVRRKYRGTIISVDKNGQLVKKRVTGWHETPLGNRSVYKLSYRLAKTAGKHKTGIHLTGDHPVLTERGYISAEKLKKDDRIATGQGLSSTLQDLVIGMLLGDGHICHNNAHLSFSHSIKQKDYAQFKAFLLKKELGCTINKLKVRAGFKKQYPIIQCYTRADRSLWILRNDFYASKKRVPQYLKTSLNPLIVAIWFMDDGYMRIRKGGRQPRAEIATCAFTPRDINILISGLKNIGVEAYQIKNRIHFNVKAAKRLSELIAPYIPPSMRYKLHPEVEKKIAFNSNLFKLGEKGTFYDTVECKKVKHTGSDKTFFCIDVEETNNFVTSGGVVHNCRPPENRAPLPDEVETCIPFLQQQIETIKPKVIVCLGSTAFQHLLKTEEKISQTRGHWREYLGRKVMPTYHPAFLLRNPNMKRPVWEDMQEVMRVLKKT